MKWTKEDTVSEVDRPIEGSTAPQSQVRSVCSSCGAKMSSQRTSMIELATNAVCVVLLATILIFVMWISERWLDQEGQKVFHQLIWQERFDDW